MAHSHHRRRRTTRKSWSGFTLIEIVLVLAIAGLILIIVFLAVSGAQRTRRDAQRKSDIARIAAAVNSYAANNNDHTPDDPVRWSDFITTYINRSNFIDPLSGQPYDIPYRDWDSANHTDVPTAGQVFIQMGHWCNQGSNSDGTSNPIAGNDINPRNYAVWGGLENGGYLCVDGR
jgi:prepilin-type N-terminal cleavage/methylation domain-containing protein